MLKVLRIHTSNSQGGAGHSAMNINKAVNRKDVDSWFYSIRGFTDLNKKVISLNEGTLRRYSNVLAYRIFGKEGFFNKKIWLEALKDLDDFDLVHLHNTHGYYLPFAILEKLLEKPCVWTLHDYRLVTGGEASPLPPYKNKSLAEHLLPFANFNYPAEWINRSGKRRKKLMQLIEDYDPSLVAVSQTMKNKLHDRGLSDKNIHVIPHGLFDEVTPLSSTERHNARRKMNWPIEKHIILFVSAQIDNPVKAFSHFIEALKELPEGEKWTAYIIGSNYQSYENKVNALNLNVHFLGKVNQNEMSNYYKACDTYVSTSLDETFGRTVLEAGAEGAEIICSDLPIFREMAKDTATYFEPANTTQLAKKLRNVIKNPLTSSKRYENAEKIRKRFSRERMAEDYIRLYKNKIYG